MKKKRKRLDPKLARKVEERSYGLCEVCGRQAVEIHHVFFGWGVRRLTERLECLIHLCYECHRGNKGVHFNKKLDDKLKRQSQQELLDQGYTEDEVREITGGKFYL